MSGTQHAPVSITFFQRGHIFGGAEESLLFNSLDLKRRGHRVNVLCLDAFQVADRYEQAGLEVSRHEVRSLGDLRQPSLLKRLSDSLECRSKRWTSSLGALVVNLVSARHLRAFRAGLSALAPDVLFGNMNAGGDHQFLRLAHELGCGTVSHQQITPPVWVGRRLLDDVNSFCGGLMSNSAWTRGCWIRKGMRADRHEVIYNTLLPVEPTADDLRARAGLSGDARVLVSVGRLSVEKCFESGIRSFAAVARDFPAWHYVIIGEGAERDHLCEVSRELGIADRVHLVGQLPGASAYLHQADVFLHPTPAEHFGRVVAEAMLARTMALAHDSGGVPEMIQDGSTGFLFSDQASMENKLRDAMSSSRDERMLARARARIEELCGMTNADKLDRLVRSAAAIRTNPHAMRATDPGFKAVSSGGR